MKQLHYLSLVGLLCILSCKKNNISGNGCISLFAKHYLNGSDSLAAVNLLKQNGIPYSNLAYERVTLNDTIKSSVNYTVYQHIFVVQYFNGLPLFLGEVGYHFRGGVFYLTDGARYNSISLNKVPVLGLQTVRGLYLDEFVRNGYPAGSFKDSCLSAQFGYYNLNGGSNNPTPNFAKAWMVTPKNLDFPKALFLEGSGQTVFFDSGVEAEEH